MTDWAGEATLSLQAMPSLSGMLSKSVLARFNNQGNPFLQKLCNSGKRLKKFAMPDVGIFSL